MKIIQLGVGGFGSRWAEVLANNKKVQVVGLVDISKEELAKTCKKYGYANDICYTDLDKALKTVSADILVCVTPPDYHLEHTTKAMQAGLHVICEKPMANTLEDCIGMLHASREYGRQLAISQNYRYRPEIMAMHTLIQEGAIGKIGQIKLDFYKGWYFDETNFRQTMPHPIIIDMSIHHFDLLRFITRLEAETVQGESWNPHWSHNEGDTSAALLMKLSNGARFVYNASWCAQGDFCDWNGNWLIEGDKGSIVYKQGKITLNHAAGRYTIDQSEKVKPLKMSLTDQDYVLNEFMKAVQNGTEVETTVADNLRSIRMVFASVTAVDTHTEVEILTPELKALL